MARSVSSVPLCQKRMVLWVVSNIHSAQVQAVTGTTSVLACSQQSLLGPTAGVE